MINTLSQGFMAFMAVAALSLGLIAENAYAEDKAAAPAAVVGQSAPDFTGTDSNGKSHRLSDFKGKTVVLEWTNHECPFVKKHYNTGNMQALQKEAVAQGAVWLTVLSSAEGKQGFTTPEQANEVIKTVGSAETARILDPSGEIGRLYGAKTTPHMFIVNGEGTLAYAGAIDDNPSPAPEDVKGAKNYVREALAELAAGKPVTMAQTNAYGCGVKY